MGEKQITRPPQGKCHCNEKKLQTLKDRVNADFQFIEI